MLLVAWFVANNLDNNATLSEVELELPATASIVSEGTGSQHHPLLKKHAWAKMATELNTWIAFIIIIIIVKLKTKTQREPTKWEPTRSSSSLAKCTPCQHCNCWPKWIWINMSFVQCIQLLIVHTWKNNCTTSNIKYHMKLQETDTELMYASDHTHPPTRTHNMRSHHIIAIISNMHSMFILQSQPSTDVNQHMDRSDPMHSCC